jgi:hypothetical protein
VVIMRVYNVVIKACTASVFSKSSTQTASSSLDLVEKGKRHVAQRRQETLAYILGHDFGLLVSLIYWTFELSTDFFPPQKVSSESEPHA